MSDALIANRILSMPDQAAFAKLSGDRNPIHVDPVASRRLLFGAPVAHGVHTLLWSLDQVCRDRPDFGALEHLRAYFDAPVVVGEPTELEWSIVGERSIRGRARTSGGNAMRFSLRYRPDQVAAWSGATEQVNATCDDPDLAGLVGIERVEPLILPPLWRILFPHLYRQFAPAQVATLLASTRIVGMKIPGQNSVFSLLSLSFGKECSSDQVRYWLSRYDERVNLAQIKLKGRGIEGELQAFRRPAPAMQPSFEVIAPLVGRDEFQRQRALVVGGSRGLGELTAKLLLSGGAHVTLTYSVGRDEADKLVDEGRHRGFDVDALQFDVLSENPTSEKKFSHLYYFATPKIPVSRSGQFDARGFGVLADFYIKGFAATCGWFAAANPKERCTAWMPSTVFIEDEEGRRTFAEYVAAKECAETLCGMLSRSLALRVYFDRLPRLPTDQTQAIVSTAMNDDAATFLLMVLRKLNNEPTGNGRDPPD
jgi:hypothetical protein